MERWAKRQGIGTVKVFTDEAGAVDVGAIKRAIREIVDAGNVEQLLIYFAGHGVNIQRNEYWLLSDAPRDSNAAVNVRGSVQLAEDSGISHVVFISDACRPMCNLWLHTSRGRRRPQAVRLRRLGRG